MITIDDVKQISKKISLENGISDDNLSEDVSEIVYRIDVLECDDTYRYRIFFRRLLRSS